MYSLTGCNPFIFLGNSLEGSFLKWLGAKLVPTEIFVPRQYRRPAQLAARRKFAPRLP
jgi:hypothetical protein